MNCTFSGSLNYIVTLGYRSTSGSHKLIYMITNIMVSKKCKGEKRALQFMVIYQSSFQKMNPEKSVQRTGKNVLKV